MYYVLHASLEDLLDHFGIEPIPDSPPTEPEAFS
jgi:hypothetical protein